MLVPHVVMPKDIPDPESNQGLCMKHRSCWKRNKVRFTETTQDSNLKSLNVVLLMDSGETACRKTTTSKHIEKTECEYILYTVNMW